MRLADYVIDFLRRRGIDTAFTVCGGGAIFLCDALAKSGMRYVACHHEQAAAMAAESYARVRTGLGLAIVTSGPGGTNAITGVAGAWTDHVPTITISGQVFSNQTINGRPGLRTVGVQEINIVDIVQPITKYAVMVRDPKRIRYELEKAVYFAEEGRPGPVWLDLPADIQNAQIEPESLDGFVHEPRTFFSDDRVKDLARTVLDVLKRSKRPLIHVGQGVRLAGAIPNLFGLLDIVKAPVVTARNGADMIPTTFDQYVGRPGTFAQRGANFAVQTCDVYLAIGTRLSLAQTGYNAKDYARNAFKVQVDICREEIEKDTVPIDLAVQADALHFIRALTDAAKDEALPDWSEWLGRCKAWQAKYPPVTDEQRHGQYVNSYHLADVLSTHLNDQDIIVTDMGFAFQCFHQAFRVKLGQRFYTNCGLASMGWGLPAAIGAAVGSGRRVICIVGDGGMMMNVQELATVAHHNLPIKIFLLNNGGYLTMRQSQAHAFDGYMGSDEASGLSFPDFETIAIAHGIGHDCVKSTSFLDTIIRTTIACDGPCFVEVMMDPEQAQIPKSVNRRENGKIVQTPIEDAWPYLDRAELAANLEV